MKIIFMDENGHTKEYDVILTFYNEEYSKNYCLCTDNEKGSDGKVNTYLYESNEKDGQLFVKDIEDKEEFKKIKKETSKLLSRLDNNID